MVKGHQTGCGLHACSPVSIFDMSILEEQWRTSPPQSSTSPPQSSTSPIQSSTSPIQSSTSPIQSSGTPGIQNTCSNLFPLAHPTYQHTRSLDAIVDCTHVQGQLQPGNSCRGELLQSNGCCFRRGAAQPLDLVTASLERELHTANSRTEQGSLVLLII